MVIGAVQQVIRTFLFDTIPKFRSIQPPFSDRDFMHGPAIIVPTLIVGMLYFESLPR